MFYTLAVFGHIIYCKHPQNQLCLIKTKFSYMMQSICKRRQTGCSRKSQLNLTHHLLDFSVLSQRLLSTLWANLVLFSRKGDETEEEHVTSFLKNTTVINGQIKRVELFSGSSRDNPKDPNSFICNQVKIPFAVAANDGD